MHLVLTEKSICYAKNSTDFIDLSNCFDGLHSTKFGPDPNFSNQRIVIANNSLYIVHISESNVSVEHIVNTEHDIIDACGLFGYPNYIIFVSAQLHIGIVNAVTTELYVDERFTLADPPPFNNFIKIFPSSVNPEIYCVTNVGKIVTLRWAEPDGQPSLSSKKCVSPKYHKPPVKEFFRLPPPEIPERLKRRSKTDEKGETNSVKRVATEQQLSIKEVEQQQLSIKEVEQPIVKKVTTQNFVVIPDDDSEDEYGDLIGSHGEESDEVLSPSSTVPPSTVPPSIPSCLEKSQLIVSDSKLNNLQHLLHSHLLTEEKIIITVKNVETGRGLVASLSRRLPLDVYSLCTKNRR
ncbi:hypothetical protein GEMRC1_002256 [Eukaryota sp. GEM-RC1]